ncbi:Uncharacterised protein [Neisseria meningitidis]|nr:Uncharacterised protein [Neisseria meningitidis]
MSVLRDAHADALARVRVILRVDADEEMLARNNQRAFGFEYFVQGLRRNGQVFKPEPQENRAFGFVDFHRVRAQLALEQRDGGLRLIAVKRPDDLVGKPFHLAAFQQRGGDGRAEARGGKVHNRVQAADGFDDFGRGDDDAGAHARQTDFGKAEAEDDVFMPIQRYVAVNDVGERHSVGVVDNQRNAVFLRQSVQTRHFAVGQHVAGRVGRARTANRADFARFEFGQVFQCVKVHAVFEEACFAFVFDVFDFGLDGNEVLPFDMHVGIADVFGRERQQNGFFCGCAV